METAEGNPVLPLPISARSVAYSLLSIGVVEHAEKRTSKYVYEIFKILLLAM